MAYRCALESPAFELAERYARQRLETELDGMLYYHCASHTTEDVLPAVIRLGRLAAVGERELRLLQVAAMYHDIGFIVRPDGHEVISAQIAKTALPGFGFSADDINTIVGIIMATHLPQSPQNLLEALLADSDLDLLGREDFLEKNRSLRRELEAFGHTTTDRDWYVQQLAFLHEHTYFTEAARNLRNPGKLHNEAALRAILKNM